MRACNYASHLNAFSKYIIDQVGFIRMGYDGSQDYDFELRVMEKARKIIHIPKVLYYCRAGEGSVALDPESKMYAYEAGRLAIEEHIKRIGYPGQVEFLTKTFSYRIHYEIKNKDKVSIIILNKDHKKELKRCIDSIVSKTSYLNYEIIIVENNSEEISIFDYYEELKNDSRIKVITYETNEFNFSELNNFGVKHTDSPYLLFLNNDTEIINENWLSEMLMFAQRDDVGAVGAKLYYPDETYQHIGLFIGLGGHIASHYDHRKNKNETGYMHRLSMPQNYNAVTAACLLIKRQDFLEINGFDEVNFKIGLNDIDLCLKLRELSKLNVVTPYAELYHYESISRGSDEVGEAKKRFEREVNVFRMKWKKYYENDDEYLNPNF
jgi:GT2 family glycosyltransferase